MGKHDAGLFAGDLFGALGQADMSFTQAEVDALSQAGGKPAGGGATTKAVPYTPYGGGGSQVPYTGPQDMYAPVAAEPPYMTYALIGGGSLLALGLVYMATRPAGRTVTANRRRGRKRVVRNRRRRSRR